MTKNAQNNARNTKRANSITPRNSARKSHELDGFTFSTGQSGSQSFTNLVSSIRSSRSLKDAIEHLDLTFSEFGRLLGQSPQFNKSRPGGFSKPYISMINTGDRVMTSRMTRAIEWAINKSLIDALGVEIGVKITRNSPWHFRLAMNCDQHGRYEIDGRRRHCPKCRAR